MKECLQRLIEVQEVDNTISAERADQKVWQDELDKEREAMDEIRAALKQHQDEVLALRKEIDRKSLDIKEKDQAIENDRANLIKVTSNREYKAILAQIEKDKADLSVIEDRLLEEMGQVDEVAGKVEEEKVYVKEQEQVLSQKEAEVKGLTDSSNQRIAELEASKSAIVSEIDAELVAIYEKLSERGEGNAVASAEGGVCGGCNMTLTSQTVSELMERGEIIRCMSCGRILYLEDEKVSN